MSLKKLLQLVSRLIVSRTDVGVLLPSGFPRQASAYVTVAGVNIKFSMPHIESIGLGGGSIVRIDGGKVSVGPDSVGYLLDTKAKVFGGDVLTATDIAVAAGGESIGDFSLVKHLQASTVADAQAKIKALMERVVDRMKTSPVSRYGIIPDNALTDINRNPYQSSLSVVVPSLHPNNYKECPKSFGRHSTQLQTPLVLRFPKSEVPST